MSKEVVKNNSSLYCPYQDIYFRLQSSSKEELERLSALWDQLGPKIFYAQNSIKEKEMVNAIYTDVFGYNLLKVLSELTTPAFNSIILYSCLSFSLTEHVQFFEKNIVLPTTAPLVLTHKSSHYFAIIPLENIQDILSIYLFTFLTKNF